MPDSGANTDHKLPILTASKGLICSDVPPVQLNNMAVIVTSNTNWHILTILQMTRHSDTTHWVTVCVWSQSFSMFNNQMCVYVPLVTASDRGEKRWYHHSLIGSSILRLYRWIINCLLRLSTAITIGRIFMLPAWMQFIIQRFYFAKAAAMKILSIANYVHIYKSYFIL